MRALPLFPGTAPSVPAADGRARVDAAPRGRLGAYSLRVSVLEQCPYHCPYCLPGSVVRPAEKSAWLTPAEHARLAPLFARAGVTKVRFTGGEPLVRSDLADIVAAWRTHAPAVERALTTNAQRLLPQLRALVDAGLLRLTIHIDSLQPDRYRALMGDADPADILHAAHAARQLGVVVKLNVVVQRGKNDDELLAFLDLGRAEGIEVRFIEQMNTGSAAAYVAETFLSGADIRARIHAARGVTAAPRRAASDPAALFVTGDGTTFGVIASDTEPFCAACDRLRLTADGRLRGCLYESGGTPLGAVLKAGATDEALASLVDGVLLGKHSHHPLAAPTHVPFSMADVGG